MAPKSAKAGSLADPVMLEKIDALFASGVGEFIPLPQLVVVGDQSSGKSSVLEGLTDLPFPRDSGLCTRFATQITFRRSIFSKIVVSIIPASDASDEHKEEVRGWGKELDEFNAKTFAEIMEEVQEVMGLGERADGSMGSSFSEDVLRLEISDPNQQHLSVVDVPGIFRKTTEGVTTKADRDLVSSMVRRYMDNPRSIMLTVIPANVDIATQEILTMAEEADEDGFRTLGVLTKPDLVDNGAEKPVIELITGERHKLKLGWCIVRNLGQNQLQKKSLDRHALESKFFKETAPWKSLDRERVGIAALRARLQDVLTSNIRREFPKVRSDILSKLSVAKQALNGLGGKRETPHEQRDYLLRMSTKFQEIVSQALNASYVGSDWFEDSRCLRFATVVANRNEQLADMVATKGHTYAFEASPGTLDDFYPGQDEPRAAGTVPIRFMNDIIHLADAPSFDDFIEEQPQSGIIPWLKKEYSDSRGFDLGSFDNSLLARAMKIQSSNWVPIALGYIQDTINMAHEFILELLRLVAPEKRVQAGLMSVLIEDLTAMYEQALQKVNFLLSVEREGKLVTLNHYYNDNLEKNRQERIKKHVEANSFNDERDRKVVRVEALLTTHHMSNEEHIIQDIHDILKSYYKVARKRFVDNLCLQAADYYLVTGPNSPLRLFSPSFVIRLTEDQLAEIAGEDSAVKRKRLALKKEIAGLEAGRKVLA